MQMRSMPIRESFKISSETSKFQFPSEMLQQQQQKNAISAAMIATCGQFQENGCRSLTLILSLSLSLSPFFPEIGICEMKFRPQVKCVTE